WIGSVFTFLYSMILLLKTFTGKHQPEKLAKKPHEAPLGMLISPLILASLVIGIGFFPNVLSGSIIEPATAAILPSLLGSGEAFQVQIHFWHGFTPELFMTIGVIVVGSLLYVSFEKWKHIYNWMPQRMTFNNLYDSSLVAFGKGANTFSRRYMTGSIRSYL